MSMILDGSNGVTFNDASLQGAAASPYVLKNRIINGDMVIDQRNSGTSVTPTVDIYTLDRWKARATAASKYSVQQNAGSVTPPTGFTYYLGVTSLSAYSVVTSDFFAIEQNIEGFNTADLGFGTANAKTVTLSFWVRSSLTGTFGGAIYNSAANRSYVFSYTITTANTWEYKTVTIAGDTTGTWLNTNGTGLVANFTLASGSNFTRSAGSWSTTGFAVTGTTSVVGTSGATFYITGVQLEQNTSATPFERRLYNQELANCQRYFEKSYPISVVPGTSTGNGSAFSTQNVGVTTASFILTWVNYKVTKRTDATVAVWDTVGTSGKCTRFTLGAATSTNQNITIDLS
jgi:hypothetical protein